jgi:hypothetical protein
VVESSILPVNIGMDPEEARQLALTLADRARGFDGAGVGVSLVFAGEPQPQGLFAGTVYMALAQGDEPARELPPMQSRAMLPEIQRRAALHAADQLRQEYWSEIKAPA